MNRIFGLKLLFGFDWIGLDWIEIIFDFREEMRIIDPNLSSH